MQIATVAAASAPSVDADRLTIVATACRDHRQLHFEYRGHDGGGSTRRTEPHRLSWGQRCYRWYLVAWDLDRADWRSLSARQRMWPLNGRLEAVDEHSCLLHLGAETPQMLASLLTMLDVALGFEAWRNSPNTGQRLPVSCHTGHAAIRRRSSWVSRRRMCGFRLNSAHCAVTAPRCCHDLGAPHRRDPRCLLAHSCR
ncbi:WYL domain-containing protein [Nonomuraea turkmeniaca]|uniref:WYL domain-containing protein n=1 Tax=Nonomuraea turkmeniaca TaxID=103838 RepID=A0A5S4EXC3_9ACTN|nr:WYL domain-containing protein [Nonomuraea turkmeniaca]TMR08136.1 WYL domain-containing protein [Nonomuraea turkmeniaca]